MYVSDLFKQQSVFAFYFSVSIFEDPLRLTLIDDYPMAFREIIGDGTNLRQLLSVNVHVMIPPLPGKNLRRAINGFVNDLSPEESTHIMSTVSTNILRERRPREWHIREMCSHFVIFIGKVLLANVET
jgi:hypothetical protein